MWKRKTTRQVHQIPDNWQTGIKLATWAPTFKDSFEGPYGGPAPSNSMLELYRISYSISNIFFYLFPISLFYSIARMSQKYAFDDCVAPAEVMDCDDIQSKKKRLVPYRPTDPNKRHRANKDSINFTTGYVIPWIGILVYYESLRTARLT